MHSTNAISEYFDFVVIILLLFMWLHCSHHFSGIEAAISIYFMVIHFWFCFANHLSVSLARRYKSFKFTLNVWIEHLQIVDSHDKTAQQNCFCRDCFPVCTSLSSPLLSSTPRRPVPSLPSLATLALLPRYKMCVCVSSQMFYLIDILPFPPVSNAK